jgi:hypothetical protein
MLDDSLVLTPYLNAFSTNGMNKSGATSKLSAYPFRSKIQYHFICKPYFLQFDKIVNEINFIPQRHQVALRFCKI